MPVRFMFHDAEALSNAPRAQGMEVHAWGLLHPGHMEWTKDGRLLVSEYGRGRVTDITDGGDYRDATPFATGLSNPAGIITTYQGSGILVADNGSDEIIDISHGGDVSGSPRAIFSVPAAYGIVEFQGGIYANFSDEHRNGVVKLAVGRSFTESETVSGDFPTGPSSGPAYSPHFSGCSKNWTSIAAGERILYSHAALGAIYDVTDPTEVGPLESRKVVSDLSNPLGMWYDEGFRLLFIAERDTGSVKAVPLNSPVSPRFIPPLVTGLRFPSCIRLAPDRSALYVCDFHDCCVWRVPISR
jgi:hypothetical protein